MSADQKASERTETCHWTEDAVSVWRRSCSGGLWTFGAGGPPSEHGMRFCFECGRKLVEHLYQEEETERPEQWAEQRDHFKKELEGLINRHSIENKADIPETILADMICRVIESIGPCVKKTLDWHGCNSVCHPACGPEHTTDPRIQHCEHCGAPWSWPDDGLQSKEEIERLREDLRQKKRRMSDHDHSQASTGAGQT